jgi:hypothetical protein
MTDTQHTQQSQTNSEQTGDQMVDRRRQTPLYRYMLTFVDNGGATFGRIDVSRPVPIVSQHEVEAVERALREHYASSLLTVLAFSRYTDPRPANPAGATVRAGERG